MNKIVFVLCALVALATVLAVSNARKPTDDLPDLTGSWASWRSSMRIARESGHYDIDVANPNGFLGGKYSGVVRAGTLEVAGPLAALCGEIRYVRQGDKLEYCGEEFARASREDAMAPAVSSVRK